MQSEITEQNQIIIEPQKNSIDIFSLLSKVFYPYKNDPSSLSPIIKSTDELPYIFYLLKNDEILNYKEKFKILEYLMTLFKLNSILINLFLKKCKSNITSFYQPIIDLYLSDNEDNTQKNQTFLEEMLIYIINKVSIPKFIIEYIYQKLSIYLRYTDTEKEKINKLSRNTFMKYLNLLEIFYTYSLQRNIMDLYNINSNNTNEEVIADYIEEEKHKEIKNYLYFNGANSKITIFLNKNSNNINCDFPTLQNGFSVVFWINLEEKIIKEHYSIYDNENKSKVMTLLYLMFGDNQIRVQLINENNILIIIDDAELEHIDISKAFKYDKWNNICIIFDPKKSEFIKIIINGETLSLKSNISKKAEIKFSGKICNISLFENLIGKINSILFCPNTLSNELIEYFNKSQGFYKIKYLYKFLLAINNNYYQYASNHDDIVKYKNQEKKNLSKINILLDNQNIKNIVGLFCCFTYDEHKNQIDDVFGNYIAVISSEDDGANNYFKYYKNIEQIGEINNLLPIIELMLLSHNKEKLCSSINIKCDDIDIEDLITEELFLKYLHIVKKIIKDKKNNLMLANNTKFFSHLGLFLEKFPSKIYSNRIRNLFYELGKESFQYSEEKNNNFSFTFINMILLNEKIFSKFSEENQLILWGDIYKFFTSDYSQLKDSLSMSKICLLLRFYDKDRYTKYCCKRHANLFDEETSNSILEPDMNIKVGKLFEIIQLFVDNLSNENETANLFKLLSLDISPCLQKKVITTYQKYFDNRKINHTDKEKALNILLNNQFFEIFEYCISISLFDVRIQLIELLRILHNEFKNKIDDYISKNPLLIKYIGEYILPDNLEVDIKNEKKEKLHLINYFNKDIYQNDINSMYEVINNWITYKILIWKKMGNAEKLESYSEANIIAINIFIIYVSKVSPFYIDCLLILLFSIISNTTINNNKTFLNNDYFYKWLFEIIFFFNNKENEKLIEESQKTNIELIKAHSIEIFKQFINFKNPNKHLVIIYLLDYSFYLKEKNKNEQNQIKEIITITRNLLNITIEALSSESSFNLADIMSKICFEFMFLYKNNENILNNIKEIKDDNKEENNNINIKIDINFNEGLYEDKEENKNEINNNINNNIQNFEHNKSFDDINIKDNKDIKDNNINAMNSIINLVLIPDYLMNNLFLKEHEQNNNDINKEIKIQSQDNNILNAMWEDFNLYNFILDFYHDSIWGIESMCRHVKINYDKNVVETFYDLLKKYNDTKNKNLLLKTLIRYLNYEESESKKKNEKINIFNLIIILLCTAYDTTLDKDEKILIENQIEQFLIFCILSSINISSSEKAYNILQNKLYDLIGFGLLFFKKRNETKYNYFLEKIIKPLFDGVPSENTKKGIKGIFTLPKKAIYKNTALDKLYVAQDELDESDQIDNDELNKTLKSGFTSSPLNLNDDIPNSKSESAKKKDKKKKDKKEKKEKKDKKDKKNNIKLIFRGNGDAIVKHIINDTIGILINNRKNKLNTAQKYIKEYYYQNNNKLNEEENKLIFFEKKRIKINILNIVPDFENNIRKYSNTSLVQEKLRRNNYQKTKKKLFSWRSFWSQKNIFYTHPENLKLKIKNHFTKEMTKILLSPILDIDYYYPPFKKFKTEKLFNKDDIKYKINLNIENILIGNEENENESNEIKEKSDELILSKNKYGFNYLECLYKLNYEGLWDKYKMHYEQKINLEINNNNSSNNNLNTKEEDKIVIEKIKISSSSANLEEKQNETNKKNKLFKIFQKNKSTKKTFSIFKCCLVKPTHHLYGYIKFNSKKIKFNYSLEDKPKNLTNKEMLKDPSYDKDMNNCFGSTFNTNLRDKDKVYLYIYLNDIKYIFIKKYFYQSTAMEIYTINNKSYFFNFKTSTDLGNYLNQFLSLINYREIKTEDHKGKKILGYEQMFNANTDKKIKSYYISNKVDEWQNFKISSLEYLMWLNIYSGRSFNDLTQYPVFPWIITNFTSNELDNENDFRNMSLPIGMMELADNEKSIMRKDTFIELYNTVKNDLKENFHDFNYQEFLKKGDDYFYSYQNKKLKTKRNYSVQITSTNEINKINKENSENNVGNNQQNNENIELVELNQIPSFYSSHYSNPTYVSHFMTRVFPFSFISIEIQGEKFDDPNRIFHSMEKTYESCMTLKDDVRELIPEFYYFPEMFLNLNNLNLTQDLLDANGEKFIINDVELPLWSEKKVANFIVHMRNVLENNKIKINKWIDIIFGIFQRGEKAEEIHNLFQAQSYEGMVKVEKIKDLDMRDALMRLFEVGVTPMQIFDKESKPKIEEKKLMKNNIYSLAKGLFLDDKKCKLNKFFITSNNYKSIYHKLYENYKLTDNRDYQEEIYPQIISIKCINPKNLKIFTNKNSWYFIKISNHDNKPIFEEKNINLYQNNSSEFAPSFQMCSPNIPYIIYNNEKYIIKGGFWDSHLEINSLINEQEIKNKDKDKEKEEKNATNIFATQYGPIEIMKMTADEKLLFCGTKYGNIIIYTVNGSNLRIKAVLYDHSDIITSISINENLNMFATTSKDGYINLYILPSFSMVRSIFLSKGVDFKLNFENFEKNKKDEYIYANNIFLSSTPLPCFTIYILEKHIFKTYSINGEFIYQEEESESTGSIKCPIIFKNILFNDFLIYGTEDGFIKIKSFPDMKLINSIKPFEGQEIKALELSPDKRFCYAWSHREKIVVIKDINTSTGFEVKDDNNEHAETLVDKITAE